MMIATSSLEHYTQACPTINNNNTSLHWRADTRLLTTEYYIKMN